MVLTFNDMVDIRQPKKLYYCGVRIQQAWTTLFVLEDIFNKNLDIKVVVELGTGSGALTYFFGQHMYVHDGAVWSYDTENTIALHCLNKLPIRFVKTDVMKSRTVKQIKQNTEKERALIFCDAGEKDIREKQFRLYTSILKPNDIIMIHDYGNSIKLEQVQDLLDSAQFELYRQEDFDSLQCYILSMRRLGGLSPIHPLGNE